MALPTLYSNPNVNLKLLWNDWRGGQLNLILSSLILAIAVVTAVSLLADRVERGLNSQISQYLAADLSVRSGIGIDSSLKQQATEIGLETADTAEFSSVVFVANNADSNSHLANIKAAQDNYPLRGQLEVSSQNSLDGLEKVSHAPMSGEVWVEPRLLKLLNIKLGDNIEIGYHQFKTARIIINEPDRGIGFSNSSARLIINLEDLAATGLVRPGSRINYSLLLAGENKNIEQFKNWFTAQKEKNENSFNHYRLQTPESSQRRLSSALQKGRTFLLLSGIVGILLAGLALALACHQYASRLTNQIALMKAWGQSSQRIRQSLVFRLLAISLVATALGLLLGWFGHVLLMQASQSLFDTQLPSASWRPWLLASLTGFICILGFAVPALWHLPNIAPLRVLRQDLPNNVVNQSKRIIIGLVGLSVLTLWYSQDWLISLMFLGAVILILAVCSLIALQFLKLVQRLANWQGSIMRLGLANLWRHKQQTLIQLVAFSLTLMLLLIVTGLRTNLVSEWQAQLPEDTPNYFLFNVSPQELKPMQQLLQDNKAQTGKWYPMVRGRISKINGESIQRSANKNKQRQREINLTQTLELPEGNTVVEGEWWQSETTSPNSQSSVEVAIPEVSMERDFAQPLGLKLGDVIEFSVGGLTFNAKLSSFREINWQNMTPNFFIIFKPNTLDQYIPNWITTIRTEQSNTQQENKVADQLIKKFPTAVFINVENMINRIRNVIERVSQGLELIFLMVLVCAILVLFAAIGISYNERIKENAILRTLGSSKKMILGALAIEYASLGAIAGIIASIGTEAVLFFAQRQFFEMPTSLHPMLWIYGIFAGTIIITFFGLLRSRDIIRVPPLQSLRQIV